VLRDELAKPKSAADTLGPACLRRPCMQNVAAAAPWPPRTQVGSPSPRVYSGEGLCAWCNTKDLNVVEDEEVVPGAFASLPKP
jgi:hypothetical protein